MPDWQDIMWDVYRKRAEAAYHDNRYEERKCDLCGRLYRGPAVYCSLNCAESDSGFQQRSG